MRHKQFGKSSEKHCDQAELFNEAELESCEHQDALDEDEEEPTEPEQDKKKKYKSPGGRKPFSEDLPRVEVLHNLTDEEKAGAIDTFHELVKEELDIIPAKIRVLQHFQEKAVFKNPEGRSIKRAELPQHILPKTMASAALLAYIVVSKYCDGLPLYRLETIFHRYHGDLSRTNMANWIIRLNEPLQPLLNLFRDHMFNGPYINADETRIQVLKEPDKPPESQSQMWVQVCGINDQKVVLFDYDPSRSSEIPLRLLAEYDGYLQTDGYAAYNEVCRQYGIMQLGCWDHCRRKFKEAFDAQPKDNDKEKGKKKNKNTAPSKATIALSYIRKLYAIEREIKDLSPEIKTEQRQTRSLVILNQLKTWADKTQPKVAKDSKTGKAFTYMNNQWEKLTRYCEDGRLNISNCAAENAIRPFVIGRKAWMFADTPKGAHASAALYSIIETAKANGLEPYYYLLHIFKELPKATCVEDYEQLLPWNVNKETIMLDKEIG